MKNNNYKPSEFAEIINVSVRTLQRWDKERTLKAFRPPTDRIYYTYEQYKEFKGIISSEISTIIVNYQVSLDGLKKCKKKMKEDEEVEKSIQNRD